MSELSTIEIEKINPSTILLTIFSLREDALPNKKLIDANDIARTGFTLFVNTVFEYSNQLNALKTALQTKATKSIYQTFFSNSTTHEFIKSAKLHSIRIDSNFNTSELNIEESQKRQLHQYMSYNPEEGDPNSDEDFNVDVFQLGDRGYRLREILGEENYLKIAPQIQIELEFKDAKWLEGFRFVEEDSTLDTHIIDWLNHE